MSSKHYYYASRPRLSNPGQLTPYIESFAESLRNQGYSFRSIDKYASSIAHFGEWINSQKIALADTDLDVVVRYSKHHCSCSSRRARHPVSSRELGRVRRFIRLLRKQHVLAEEPAVVIEHEHALLEQYVSWLMDSRGLSSSTVYTLKGTVAKLLPLLGADPENYDVAGVRHVIRTAVKQCSESHAKTLCYALRSYIRFLASSGRCLSSLADAVPTVPHWRLSSMPRYICPDDLAKVVAVWDGTDNRSRRNHAIILLLSRLGLRARDIVTLRIDDIHWETATLLVKGKTRQQTRLPLPQDVGNALLAYLECARGALAVPEMFLTLRAPKGPLISSSAISGIVRFTLERAGIENPPAWGAHLLRHSAATAMLREGATLQEVSMILRHRSTDMTAHYAKVDLNKLQKLAQPWPEGESC